MIRQIGRLLIAGILLAVSTHAHSQLSASVDRTEISEMDLITLTVRLSGTANPSDSPDFAGVERDFVIVGQSGPNRSSRIAFSGGQQMSESHTDWGLTLRPRRLGELTIPGIPVGSTSTNPIVIKVSEASAAVTRRMNQFVFFDTTVDTNSTYVQGQVIYSVKLFYVDGVSGDFPPPPDLDNVVIETIESERRYESIVNNRRFYVLEKRYGIYPQKSGTFTIPRETFTGAHGRGSFFSARERVSAVSDSHTLEVKPRPASFTGEHWLPARSVVLSETLHQDGNTLTVGEPFNRTLTMTVQGLASSLLPPFAAMAIPDAKTYQDPPAAENRATEAGLESTLTTTIGIVPTAPGTLTLPEITLPWWNTETDAMEVARIPARTFFVAPAPGGTVAVPSLPAVPAPTAPVTEVASSQSNLWLYVSVALFLVWVLTSWQWWSLRQQVRRAAAAPAREETKVAALQENGAYSALMQACNANNPAEAHTAVFRWAKVRYPSLKATSDLAAATGEPAFTDAILELEQALYAKDADRTWNGALLAQLVTAARKTKPRRPQHHALLPTLNPQ